MPDIKPEAIIERVEDLTFDLAMPTVTAWKARTGGKVIGHLPIYTPREVIHAAGLLPVALYGGGDRLEIIRGDAYFQSYICHLPRSTVELLLSGRLDHIDGFLFPSICDVIRNLSGMWQMMAPDKYVKYLDVPQNFVAGVGGKFWHNELRVLADDMGRLAGHDVTDEALASSIALYNTNRVALEELYALRRESPWLVPASESYVILRAGAVLPVEEHTALVDEYVAAARSSGRNELDLARVVAVGAFCEQPPLALIKTLERAGCYVVDDDFLVGLRWLRAPVADDRPPLEALASAYLDSSRAGAARYIADDVKGRELIEAAEAAHAEGVVFCSPSFCDPALLDKPMLTNALNRAGVQHTSFKYSENTGQFAVIREQAGTFADSIRLWSETTEATV